ncbi:MAG: hypothetical protein PUC65_17125 [Clostridiales bacterium]|nr:hypothetical protein [Clostridiales bacterium]
MNKKVKDRLLDSLGWDKKDRHVDCSTNILLNECCGCYVCEAKCPMHAITMEKDGEGFYYPNVK